jgi:ATP-binding cassette subfamily C protein LapB
VICAALWYLGQRCAFSGALRDNLNLTMLERDDARLMESLDFAGAGRFVRNTSARP